MLEMLSKLIEELRTNSNLIRTHYGDVVNDQMTHTNSDFYGKIQVQRFEGEDKPRSRGVHTSVGGRKEHLKQEQK